MYKKSCGRTWPIQISLHNRNLMSRIQIRIIWVKRSYTDNWMTASGFNLFELPILLPYTYVFITKHYTKHTHEFVLCISLCLWLQFRHFKANFLKSSKCDKWNFIEERKSLDAKTNKIAGWTSCPYAESVMCKGNF